MNLRSHSTKSSILPQKPAPSLMRCSPHRGEVNPTVTNIITPGWIGFQKIPNFTAGPDSAHPLRKSAPLAQRLRQGFFQKIKFFSLVFLRKYLNLKIRAPLKRSRCATPPVYIEDHYHDPQTRPPSLPVPKVAPPGSPLSISNPNPASQTPTDRLFPAPPPPRRQQRPAGTIAACLD